VPALLEMERCGMLLLVHGEVTDSDVDIFDRETLFIETHLSWLVNRFPALKLVLEHITTRVAVEFVRTAPANVAATITAHHLLMNRNAMLVGGIRPHLYCLPILKRESDRQALLDAATGGDPSFFLGTDSAPHPRHRKENACGCAGIYTAHAALAFYAEVFESAGALDRLEAFASHHGPDFYGVPRNADTVTLVREAQSVPESLALGTNNVVPLRAGASVAWRVA
jgi:dihydroorotase